MKKYFLAITISFVYLTASAQITFQKYFKASNETLGQSVVQTFDDGYALVGFINDSTISGSYLMKLNEYGDTIWTKIFATDGWLFDIKQTSDSGLIMVGFAYGDSSDDVYLIKTNQIGDTIWTKTYGGSATDQGYSIQQTFDNGFIICGVTFSYGAGNDDVYLIKTDSNGNLQWTKTFGLGGYDAGSDVKQTADSGFVIVGDFNQHHAYFLKTDANGNLIWSKDFGGSSIDYGRAVEQTTDKGFIIAGITQSFQGLYLTKSDSIGNLVWSKGIGVFGNKAYSIQKTFDGGFIIGGNTNQITLTKTDENGNVSWSKSYGDSISEGYCVKQTNDSGYVITGIVYINGSQQIYFIKTDSLGNTACIQSNASISIVNPPTDYNNNSTTVSTGGITSNLLSQINSASPIIITACSSSGIKEIINDAPRIFPNPTSGKFTITNLQMRVCLLEVYNIVGENILSDYLIGKNTEINLSRVPPGIYFVKINDSEKVFTQKLVIE